MLKSRFAAVSCAAMIAVVLAAASVAQGDIPPRMNYLKFSAPFALPGVALPAGTYVFEVIEPGQYNVVQVKNKKGGHVYLTAFTRQVSRPANLPAQQQIVFREVAAGMTPPVKAWFPIGASIGHEFIYPAGSSQLGNGTN